MILSAATRNSFLFNSGHAKITVPNARTLQNIICSRVVVQIKHSAIALYDLRCRLVRSGF